MDTDKRINDGKFSAAVLLTQKTLDNKYSRIYLF